MVLVVDFTDLTEQENTSMLSHQLAHLFGAEHTADRASVMHERPGSPTFDTKAVKVISETRDFDFSRGIYNLDASNAERIVRFFAGAGGENRSDTLAAAHSRLGVLLQSEGRTDAAVEQFREAIRLAPGYAIAHFNLGLAFQERGDSEAAIQEYRMAASADPRQPKFQNQLGIALFERGLHHEAIGAFHAAIRLSPTDALLRVRLGVVLMQQPGRLDDAIAQFHKALEVEKNLPEARDRLSLALRIKGELEDAVDRSKVAIAKNPDDVQARFNLGMALLGLGRIDRSITELLHVVRIHPGHGTAHLNLAIAYLALGQYPNARKEAELSRKSGVVPPPDLLYLLRLE